MNEPVLFKFPSIRQYREVIKEYHKLGLHQTVRLIGRPKIHGSNASIVFTDHGIQYHTKEMLLTATSGGEGFRDWAMGNAQWVEAMRQIILREMPTVSYPFAISGEWAGMGIQKKASTNGLPHFFAVFMVSNIREEKEEGIVANRLQFQGLPLTHLTHADTRCFDIREFPSFDMEMNPAFPETAINALAEKTTEVEKDCPVSRYLGKVSDHGEGVVWYCADNPDRHLIFKVKGKKHSSSKVRELVTVTPEEIANILGFVEFSCTENRMAQGVKETGPICRENKNAFVKWVHADIVKEESDTLASNGLSYDQVKARISTKLVSWYVTKINEETNEKGIA